MTQRTRVLNVELVAITDTNIWCPHCLLSTGHASIIAVTHLDGIMCTADFTWCTDCARPIRTKT